MTQPDFGIVYDQIVTDPLPAVVYDFSTGFIVSWSNDANPTLFPLDTAVRINSGDPTSLAGLGTGLLYKAVLRVNAQLALYQRSAQLVIVRILAVYQGDGVTLDVAATLANALGSASAGTGIWALKKAPQRCRVTPRLGIVPGLTGLVSFAVVNPVVTAEGQNYTHPLVTFNPPGATATAAVGNTGTQATAHAVVTPGVQATAHATLGSGGTAGQVAGIAVDAGGASYGTAPAVTLSGGGGTGATAHAVLTAGVVSSIVVDNAGTGYTSAPTVAVAAPASGKVGSVTVDNGGHDYQAVPSVTITGGGGTGATAHAVLTAGVVSSIAVDNAGTGYTSAPTVTVAAPVGGEITGVTMTSPGQYPPGTAVTATIADSQGGTGTGASVSVSLELLANPICAALPEIATALLAHALVGGPGGTKGDALAWDGTLNSSRLIPSDGWEIVETLDGTGTEYIDGVCKELGLAIACDFEHDGYPFHSWANRAVQGALGVKRIDDFSITDGATDGQELLSAGIGITVVGDDEDDALDDSGLISISYRNASNNPLFNLYNKTRGRDYIDLALKKSIRRRLGKENITLADVDAVLNDAAVINLDLMSKAKIIGFRIAFNSADNTVEGLRAGRFTIVDNTEEAAPILQITVKRGLDRDALVSELQQLGSAATVTS